MKIMKLLDDYNIPYTTAGNSRNVQRGWIGLTCPFCDDHSDHLGYNVDEDIGFNCWRCGTHGIYDTLSKLLNIPKKQVRSLINSYGGRQGFSGNNKVIKIGTKTHNLPPITTKLLSNHKKYLRSRRFDPDYIEKEWGVMGTGPYAELDGIDFKHRIIIPIYWNGKRVSFQSRDVTKKAEQAYITCSKEREIIHHKDIIYGPKTINSDIGIIVEGVTDVWRLKYNTYATLGIKFTLKQVRIISKMFKKVFIIFDSESQAIRQAEKLETELNFRGVETQIIKMKNDPASLDQTEADELVKSIL